MTSDSVKVQQSTTSLTAHLENTIFAALKTEKEKIAASGPRASLDTSTVCLLDCRALFCLRKRQELFRVVYCLSYLQSLSLTQFGAQLSPSHLAFTKQGRCETAECTEVCAVGVRSEWRTRSSR